MSSSRVRVMSLLPSATEIICAIPGKYQQTSEDDYPSDIAHLPTVIDPIIQFTSLADVDKQVVDKMKELGTLYVVDKSRIEALAPDVILTQDLCRVCSVDLMTVERIAQDMVPRPTVLNLSPTCIEDMLDNVAEVGHTVGLNAQAAAYRSSLEDRIARVRLAVEQHAAGQPRLRVLCLDWVNPYIVGGHWMPQIIDWAGGISLLSPLVTDEQGRRRGEGAKRVSAEDIVAANPDIIIIAACGLNLDTLRKEIDAISDNSEWLAVRAAAPRVVICDGHHYFNRPGPRLIDTLEFVAGISHTILALIPPDLPYQEL
ncbi:hypothetical protein GGI19_004743 [Coemansia pectinata]|uniref:Fe/B12 periplasmic-binding domain-containing protein n=1 Tax=Coemansia pectinata TaxID=1052879 RepID=A0A9W8GVH5_9FUNG|nr:hypothetical protein GGI19_004743 [Coemansia pectinata]